MSQMVDITYQDMLTLLQNLTQNKDSAYKNNILEPTIKYFVLPQIARRHHWRGITRQYKITLTADQDEYILPYDFDKFTFLKTKYGRMFEMDERDFYRVIPDRSGRSSNVITRYFVEKHSGVHTQPATAEQIVFGSGDRDWETYDHILFSRK